MTPEQMGPPHEQGPASWRDVVDGYWRNYASLGDIVASGRSNTFRQRIEESDYTWAWEEVERATRKADGDIVGRLVELAEAAPNRGALSYLGAGPVEDLVMSDGDRFLEEIETAAERSEPFRAALGGVNMSDEMSAATRHCLSRFRVVDTSDNSPS